MFPRGRSRPTTDKTALATIPPRVRGESGEDQGGQRALPRRRGGVVRLQVGDRLRGGRTGPGDEQAAQGARPESGSGLSGRARDRRGNRVLLAQPPAGG